MQPPTQELVVRDLHENTWTFRHIYRGEDSYYIFILEFFLSVIYFVCLTATNVAKSRSACFIFFVPLVISEHHISDDFLFLYWFFPRTLCLSSKFSFCTLFRAAKETPPYNWMEYVYWCKEA